MEIYTIRKDQETLKKLEALRIKMDHELWLRQEKRKRDQLKRLKRLRRKGYYVGQNSNVLGNNQT